MVSLFSGPRRRRLILLLLCAGIFMLLLGGTQFHEANGNEIHAQPSSCGSAFPTQIEIELIITAPVQQTIVVGQWNQTDGSNTNLNAQIGVNEANQTFWISSLANISDSGSLSLCDALEYNLTYLTLAVTDPNGTGYGQMINPGTISVTSSDKWSYSPLGTDTGYLYKGEYFMIEQGSYSLGLFGLPSNPFPPFPTITYNLYLFHITVPNFLALPHWLYEIVIWAFNEFIILIEIGWEDVIALPVRYLGEGIRDIANLYDGVWNDVYNLVSPLPDGLGIFALPAAAFIFGALSFITVAGVFFVAEGISKLVSL